VAKDRPSDDSAETLLLQEALATTGSVSHLAIILNVSVRDLERWLTGNELTPTSVLQAAVELIQGAGWRSAASVAAIGLLEGRSSRSSRHSRRF
jgi:hypothetical protein